LNPRKLRNVRIGLWAAILLVGGAATVFYFGGGAQNASQGGLGGGEYELVSDTGAPLDETMLKGQPSMMFFGFTHCPDVCPTTLAEMGAWYARLGDEAAGLRGYFVTVDPERDTPEVVNGYISFLPDNVVGVTGEPREIEKLKQAWGAYSEQVPLDGGGYTVNHTASVFLINSNGEFESTIAYGEGMDSALAKIRRLLAEEEA